MKERICRATRTPQFFSIPQSQSVTELLSALILLLSAGQATTKELILVT